ncbi:MULTISPECIES: response regulator transcription factor [Novosphingobium]|uniref:response regulator transcription factor n=1 Tax=Novosphingobium TaxID=165696 RepID=UPI001CD7FAD6|nr:response regulator transcription factor [Novosphingobium percolationis]MCH7629086.1 response regulator transcription factor [Pseudomonadota bacterium]
MRLLIVEDEAELAASLARGLTAEGYEVTHAADGEAALAAALATRFDFVLLDLMLPDMSGFDVAEELRLRGIASPVIMVTALDEVKDRVAGLRAGADDYIVKPFAFEELLARMEAVLRRAAPAAIPAANAGAPGGPVSFGTITIDHVRKQATIDGKPFALTSKELDLLMLLMLSPGKVFSRHEILRSVWTMDDDPLTNIVEVYISRLRRKLAGHGAQIENVRGFGYRIAQAA